VLIQELSREECLSVLAGRRVARLAFVHEGQPHIVPVYLTYDAESSTTPSLYGVTTCGEKVEWMRANPRVCVEIDEIIDFDRWMSVVVLGRYEELEDRSQGVAVSQARLRHPSRSTQESLESSSPASERLKAVQILQNQAMWWEPASTAWASRHDRKPGDRYEPVYYRVCIEQVSGHRACPQASEGPATFS